MIKVPTIRGVIDRRILVNYRVDPAVLTELLPPPFAPKLYNGAGIAGVCLIRLKQIRPRYLPATFGFQSENAAHRIAVQWKQDGRVHEGVYIPRRDTSSSLNALVGGRLFPGTHHRADFVVNEEEGQYRVELHSRDDKTHLFVEGHLASGLPSSSVFGSLAKASTFFEAGSLGYSATPEAGTYDGLELNTFEWKVEPLTVTDVYSSFFEDSSHFPSSSVSFDCALLMRDIQHEWRAQDALLAPGCGDAE